MSKIKTTITLAEHIKGFALEESRELGLDFSAYITLLIAEKLRERSLIPSGNRASNEINSKSIDEADEADEKVEESVLDDEQRNELNRLMGL
ncbi:MAG: hypothetical protein RSG52_10010 [Terrisporobacter sp.]|uniref:hypothetical protein n=1 Tax=Terrisporobacter sp. TaxID=1965305 RepID=UPI002FC6C61D